MMILLRGLALAGLILILPLLLPAPAQAQSAAGPIAVIEYERILQTSLASQSVQKQLVAIHDRIQSSIDAEEAKLVELDKKLTLQQTILAPDAYQAKRSQLDDRVKAARARVDDLNKRIEKARQQATTEIQKALYAVVSELSAERGFALVLPTSILIFAASTLNVTDEVLKRLNDRLPRVEVQFSEE